MAASSLGDRRHPKVDIQQRNGRSLGLGALSLAGVHLETDDEVQSTSGELWRVEGKACETRGQVKTPSAAAVTLDYIKPPDASQPQTTIYATNLNAGLLAMLLILSAFPLTFDVLLAGDNYHESTLGKAEISSTKAQMQHQLVREIAR
ncbi:hypothetical protein CVT26_011096 [Gymnopilus dilepis]|uniref:Uncharacterized protein n=1 Tax=Gymnopilus dilepis TaxID=231916 RepID=A0A409VJH7_9AGAR|nr:hypothetical protein CVT26_011096 [Gymnopilus dilepis]